MKMGMIEIEIEFNELRKRNIVRFDRNDDWHPYLLVNTDRAYFRKKEYADQRKIYRILLERFGQIDRDWHSTEVSETEFITEYQRRNRR